ncbi:MAG: AAA family ATPase [Caulobacterales bacterium]
MRIRELRLAGFKSFVDPTRMPIEPGLTGIVGPNGCGKSNLLEAVRWVMGAASAKALRADDMDSVIFAGSGGRPARETADVTIVLDDAAGRFAGDAAAETLEVTRRIRREAGSTYKINGRDARAKDVQLLFADASTGANSPALVRQGQISELIGAKPENRRRILEEAAGVAGLHARRHEADLKLRAAEANLQRVDEALKDMEAQSAALRRQARQAERYRQVAEELRRTEALLAARRWRNAGDALEVAQSGLRAAERAVAVAEERASVSARQTQEAAGRVAPANEEAMIAAAVLRGLEGKRIGLERDAEDLAAAAARRALESERLARDLKRADDDLTDARAACARLAEEGEALGAERADADDLDAARARAEAAETARTTAEAEFDRLQSAARAADEAASRAAAGVRAAKERLARIDARLAALARDIQAAPDAAALATRLAAARAEAEARAASAVAGAAAAAKAETSLVAADAEERRTREARDAALGAVQALAAEQRGLEAAAAGQGPAKTKKPAIEAMRAAPGYEKALAAVLGDDAAASLDPSEPVAWRGASLAPGACPDGVEPLAPHVEAPPALAARLAFSFLADAAEAPALQAVLGPGMRVVTREGDLYRWDGLVRRAGAGAKATAVRLEQRNRLAALAKDLEARRAQADAAEASWKTAATARDRLHGEARAARAAQPQAQAAASTAARAAASLEIELARLESAAAGLAAQQAALDEERAEAQSALADLAAAPAPAPVNPIALDAARAAMTSARAAAAEALAAKAALIRARTIRQDRRAAIARESADWARRAEEAQTRRKQFERDLARLTAETTEAAGAPERLAAAKAKLLDETIVAERRAAAAADALAQAQARAREAERQAREAQAHRSEATAARTQATAAVEEARVALRACETSAQGRDYAGLLADAGDLVESPLAAAPAVEIEKRIARLTGERDAAGSVNLRADEELSQALAAAETLVREKDDVIAAINKLRFAIGRLNGEARTRLRAAFEQVSAHFAALFATLFEGGEATLKLTDSDDPLAAGLEIYASPPGKKLAALSLMSGGEQALTATALIFAVFLANPAPLCVLDEVDAPLDDANVDRFCRMLAEMRKRTDTRFLAITHNPVTMARMDRLYGVTMAEAGVSQLVSVDLQRAAALAA